MLTVVSEYKNFCTAVCSPYRQGYNWEKRAINIPREGEEEVVSAAGSTNQSGSIALRKGKRVVRSECKLIKQQI